MGARTGSERKRELGAQTQNVTNAYIADRDPSAMHTEIPRFDPRAGVRQTCEAFLPPWHQRDGDWSPPHGDADCAQINKGFSAKVTMA